MTMLKEPCGRDGLVELTSSSNQGLAKTVIRKTPTKLRQIVGGLSVPAAAVAGFLVTPSRRILAHGVGAAISGIVGGIGKSRLDAETLLAVKPALAQLLLDHYSSEKQNVADVADLVKQLQQDYHVEDDEFMDICTDVYKAYLVAMVKQPYTKTADISDLAALKKVLGLDNIAVGEAHAQAAQQVYRETMTFTPEEELEDLEHPDRMSMDKLLFLSERAFRSSSDSVSLEDGAFVFEFSRVSKAFHLLPHVAILRVQNVAQPFYERALTSTRAKLETGAVSSDMLARARVTMGISDEIAADMHLTAFSDEVKSLLQGTTSAAVAAFEEEDFTSEESTSNIQFPPGTLERLEKLRKVLEISEKDAQYEISVEACPLFQATVNGILKQLLSYEGDDVSFFKTSWQKIAARQKELCVNDENMIPILDSIVTQALGKPLEEASAFASVNNEAAVYNKLLEALLIKAKISSLLEQSKGVCSAQKFFDMDSIGACFQFLPTEMRKKLYSLFLSRVTRDASEDGDANLAQIKEMLGIDEETTVDVSAIVCGPVCEKALKETADEVTAGDDVSSEIIENLKKSNSELIARMKVPSDLILKYKCEIYKNYLRFVNQNSPSGIPSSMFAERLATLQQLFDLDSTETIPMHVATFGPAYKKSVLEAMGITGVINPEYREPLNQLRDRLGVGSEEANKLFLSAISDKIVPMFQRIESELERQFLTKEQLARKRGKDIGEDMFKGGSRGDLGIATIGNVMSDIMNLVEFYTENDVPVKTNAVAIEGAAASEATSETEESLGVTYPVTAIGLKAVEPEMAEAMYHQFLVGGFTAQQGGQVARYEAAAPVFGGILGLTKERMEAVGGNVGASVYENFISNAMQTKTSLDQQDMMFLAQIQSKLKMSPEKAEEMLIDAEKKVLKERSQKLFDSATILPCDIQGLRERCNGMGMDLQGDLGISKERVAALFVMEISDGIERGSITTESGNHLTEIQESLGLSPEDCEKAIEGLVQQRVAEYLERIDKELLRGREDQCIDPIKKLIRFASFVGGDVDVEVRKDRAYKIVSLFEAADFSDEKAEVLEAQKQTLKTTLGLPN